jgi:hypothetical protein
MAHRLVRLELDVLVANGIITLDDDAGDQAAPGLNDLSEWLFAGANTVVAVSAGLSDHRAAVTIEVWDGEPANEEEPWQSRADRRLRLDSGDLEVKPGELPPFNQLLRVGPPGMYRLRGYVAGRDEIRRLTPKPDLDANRGVERFLLQFWPTE